MVYTEHLQALLPADLPHRDACIEGAAAHLRLIEEANRQFNLTRIVDAREAAIKHVLDSLLPWRLFAGARSIADAGTGAGFPGIPLALAMPEAQFALIESTQKKARFVESAVAALGLKNAAVHPVRAEDWLRANRAAIVTARAVAPLAKAVDLFAPALDAGSRLLLYKGPDVDVEIAEAEAMVRKRTARTKPVKIRVVARYGLPEQMGSRTIVELVAGPG
ncbi:MAG: 16S rRNA (guanine(527)-N(7))-methyltransferase RsmG [Bryobacteraceae bacterium]